MNKQHFIAFAQEARHWRVQAKQWEDKAKAETNPEEKVKMASAAEYAYGQSLAIEAATIKVGKRFNSRFDDVKFRQACNPDIPLKL